jgi:hypothetical protein
MLNWLFVSIFCSAMITGFSAISLILGAAIAYMANGYPKHRAVMETVGARSIATPTQRSPALSPRCYADPAGRMHRLRYWCVCRSRALPRSITQSAAATGGSTSDALIRAAESGFGNLGIPWSPSMDGAAIRALRECNSIRQLIDVCQIDINMRGDQSFCIWAFKHQLHRQNLRHRELS